MNIAQTNYKELTFHEFSDEGNACRFINEYGHRLKYVPMWKQWLVWDDCRWIRDELTLVNRLATKCVESLAKEAMEIHDDDRDKERRVWAKKCHSASRLKSMVELAKPKVAISPTDLDANRMLFNTASGTIDLEHGTLLPCNPCDFITQRSPVRYEPAAKCPRWLLFLDEIFAGDTPLIEYMQRLVGYMLTGEIKDQILPIACGDGANGKSVFWDVIAYIFGDYAGIAPESLIVASNYDHHPTEIASLRGKRLAVASETECGRKLKTSLIKKMTGDATLIARKMRKDFETFDRTHKLVIVTNHLPVVPETNNAIWRRMHVIPFKVRIPDCKQDLDLISKLKNEADGILAWIVQGCKQWQKNGLKPPPVVIAASACYRREQDKVAGFLEACCRIDGSEKSFVRRSVVFDAYRSWVSQEGKIEELSRANFFARLLEHDRIRKGSTTVRGKKERGFRGIILL